MRERSRVGTRKASKKEVSNAKPVFTTDWFSNNIPTWQRFVVPALAGKPNVLALEIGTYEGRSALWTLDNLLTGPGSHLTCIDNFSLLDPSTQKTKHKDVRQTLWRNLSSHLTARRVTIMDHDAASALRSFQPAERGFDLVYIDADGSARDCLEQAVLVFPLLKPAGLLIFDDYTHSREHDQSCPRPGIDAFVNTYARELKVVHSGWQLILQKRRKKLALPKCLSEYYHEDLSRI